MPRLTDPLLCPPPMNMGTVQGSTKINKVPDRCQARIDIRTVPGQSHAQIVAEVCRLVEATTHDWPGVQVEVQAVNDKGRAIAAYEKALGYKPALGKKLRSDIQDQLKSLKG